MFNQKLFFMLSDVFVNQRAAWLTLTPKSSFERHQNFNDVWRHCHRHQSLSMTIFVIVIVICCHRLIVIVICCHRHHYFFIWKFNKFYWIDPLIRYGESCRVSRQGNFLTKFGSKMFFNSPSKWAVVKLKIGCFLYSFVRIKDVVGWYHEWLWRHTL